MNTVNSYLESAGAKCGWLVLDTASNEVGLVICHTSGALAIHWAGSDAVPGTITTGPNVQWPSRFRAIDPSVIFYMLPQEVTDGR